MIRKLLATLLAGTMVFSLAACGPDNSSQDDINKTDVTQDSEGTEISDEESTEISDAESTGEVKTDSSVTDGTPSSVNNILIVYFSVPEDIDTDRIDANAGASVVVKDKEVLGNVQFMAETIQETIGGDLFRIETTEQYPLEHDRLVDQAAEEQDENVKPELSTHIENLEQYDTILLGYPNWWGDMPQALYTFLGEYDFSGKTIIPFCPHGGSGFSQTERTIAELQPQAIVSDNGLSISRNDVADSAGEVSEWAKSLELSE